MKKNVFYLLLADLIWGAAFVAQRTGGDVVGAYTFNCLRSFLGFLVLLPFVLLRSRNAATDTATDEEMPSPRNHKSALLGAIICGTALCFASNLQQVGITLGTSVGKAGFFTACYILLVPLLGIFLGKKTHWNVLIGIVLAVIGLYLLCITDGSLSIEKSDALLLLCAFAFAIQILAIDHFAPKVDVFKLSCYEFLVCGIESLIPMSIVEIHGGIGGFSGWCTTLSTWDAWIPLLYAGICSSGIAYTLQVAGQRNFNPSVASLIMSMESVFSLFFGWLLLQERLSSRELLGCLAIFIAVLLAQIDFSIFRRNKKKS